MDERTGKRVVHSYDTATRRVLCGVPEQSSSTKHPAGVTCGTCRALLLGARRTAAGYGDAADHVPGG